MSADGVRKASVLLIIFTLVCYVFVIGLFFLFPGSGYEKILMLFLILGLLLNPIANLAWLYCTKLVLFWGVIFLQVCGAYFVFAIDLGQPVEWILKTNMLCSAFIVLVEGMKWTLFKIENRQKRPVR